MSGELAEAIAATLLVAVAALLPIALVRDIDWLVKATLAVLLMVGVVAIGWGLTGLWMEAL